MSLESGVYTLFSSVPGSAAGDRVYPQRIPDQPTFPLIVYHVITNAGQDTRPTANTDVPGSQTAYASGGGDDLNRVRLQVEYVGKSYEQARALENQIRPYVQGFHGISGGEKFQGIYIESERDDFEPGGETERRIQDIILWHKRS